MQTDGDVFLKDGGVILYGAGSFARQNFARLKSFAGEAVCFADIDASKHYNKLCGLDTFSLSEAMERFPGCKILITVSCENMENMASFLLQQGIAADRIVRHNIKQSDKKDEITAANREQRLKYDRNSTENGLNNGEQKRDVEIVVGFTTYPRRIHAAIFVADAMLRQTMKPDRVILTLSKEEFRGDLPEDYKNLEKRGLTIVYTDGNLKPHKKYCEAMALFPDSIVITVDDDIVYSEMLVEQLYASYLRYPNAVSAMRTHRILFDEAGRLLPYKNWEFESSYTDNPVLDLMATSGAGTLFPPRCMHKDLLDVEKIERLCLEADDVWLKTMQLLKRTPVVIARNYGNIIAIDDTQDTALCFSNIDKGKNDVFIKNCLDFYGISQKQLKEMLGK
jgi:hypothetical protein